VIKYIYFLEVLRKYVNMADINSPQRSGSLAQVVTDEGGPEPTWDLIELLFFAYRDFVADPDHVLAALAFGRAHHRVLHFVNRNPGMTVADLLDILRITKQSLGRVLKALIDQDYIEQRAGPRDRRQRLLYVTAKGHALAMKLARLQTKRIKRALDELGPARRQAAWDFLVAMIDEGNRENVVRRVKRSHALQGPQG
jgi:DNA-binding MarR family transcriptional regulator